MDLPLIISIFPCFYLCYCVKITGRLKSVGSWNSRSSKKVSRSSKYYIYYLASDHSTETNELIILKYLIRYHTILMQLVHFEPYIATYIPKFKFSFVYRNVISTRYLSFLRHVSKRQTQLRVSKLSPNRFHSY